MDEEKQVCGICGGVGDRVVELEDINLTLCTDCLAAGPQDCARVLLAQAETALMAGRDLLTRETWPLVAA